ncbi:hypothetical protein HPB50_007969 [Hyalomma asiaticum]|uniref:Uncharacterized protein n=1 Tax=Hyalomma asiaticum TaxID=266040 RepID=A0ACB7T6J7_HYAAI|nr:hypothetical protein HPB50_007969 [Hyalomma asiaticum]
MRALRTAEEGRAASSPRVPLRPFVATAARRSFRGRQRPRHPLPAAFHPTGFVARMRYASFFGWPSRSPSGQGRAADRRRFEEMGGGQLLQLDTPASAGRVQGWAPAIRFVRVRSTPPYGLYLPVSRSRREIFPRNRELRFMNAKDLNNISVLEVDTSNAMPEFSFKNCDRGTKSEEQYPFRYGSFLWKTDTVHRTVYLNCQDTARGLRVGIVLITVSGIAWRLTSHEAPSCRAMLGLRGDEPGGRRFVPRVPPYGGRPGGHPYAAMLYPEFQYRPPPPSYQASMQEYRLRLLLLDRQGGPPTLPTPVALAAHHHHHHHHHAVPAAPPTVPPPSAVTSQPAPPMLSPVSPPPTYRSGMHAR